MLVTFDTPIPLEVRILKVSVKGNEMAVFYDFLSTNITSCTDVAEKTGIPQKNCTRYKKTLQKNGRLQVVKRIRCPITSRYVQGITTDATKFISTIQLTLF
jgi:N-glycosylase/DNA lyase